MKKFALVFFSLYIVLYVQSTYSSDINNPMLVSINANIWHPAKDIRWPSDKRAVDFYWNNDSAASACAELRSKIHETYGGESRARLSFGESCGTLVVLFRDDNLLAKENKNVMLYFVSSHEAFHIAAQIYGGRIPIKYIETHRPILTAHEKDASVKLRQIAESYLSFGSTSRKAKSCGALKDVVDGLSKNEIERLNFIIFWEWPAEYYAFRVMRSRGILDLTAYNTLRTEIGDAEEYTPSAPFGLMLDNLYSGTTWQHRIADDGVTMLDLFMDLCGMNPAPPDNAFTLSRWNLG